MNSHTLQKDFVLRNKYIIKNALGEGGFGITYLAKDTILDSEVCIKELYISGSSTRGENMTVLTQNMKEFSFSDFKVRFLQEAKQLAKFNHPGIVRVIEFFEENNTAYLVMEYLKGQTLKELVATNGALNFDESRIIINQLLNAVEVVHNAGMLHRDIKPDNLILTDDARVVLIDFGSAREFTDGKTVAQTAMVSPGYAPLEQYNPNARKGTFTDIYSIGATFYFMLTGHKPLNVTERWSETLEAPHELNELVSLQVSSAVLLAMEMNPDDRFQNVEDFRMALYQLSTGNLKSKKPITKEIPKTRTVKEKKIAPKTTLPTESSQTSKVQTSTKEDKTILKDKIKLLIEKLKVLESDKVLLNENNLKADILRNNVNVEIDYVKNNYVKELEDGFRDTIEIIVGFSCFFLFLVLLYCVYFNVPNAYELNKVMSFDFSDLFKYKSWFENWYYDLFSKVGLTFLSMILPAGIFGTISDYLHKEKNDMAIKIKSILEKDIKSFY